MMVPAFQFDCDNVFLPLCLRVTFLCVFADDLCTKLLDFWISLVHGFSWMPSASERFPVRFPQLGCWLKVPHTCYTTCHIFFQHSYHLTFKKPLLDTFGLIWGAPAIPHWSRRTVALGLQWVAGLFPLLLRCCMSRICHRASQSYTYIFTHTAYLHIWIIWTWLDSGTLYMTLPIENVGHLLWNFVVKTGPCEIMKDEAIPWVVRYNEVNDLHLWDSIGSCWTSVLLPIFRCRLVSCDVFVYLWYLCCYILHASARPPKGTTPSCQREVEVTESLVE